MFGNVPRALWARWIAPDAEHRIPLACRCLLVEEESGRRVLFETGIGAFFPPKLRERYGVTGDGHVLLASLAALGLTDADIDVVVLSHLHFDHAGGLLSAWSAGAAPTLLFPRARFVVGREAWARALTPHPRDRASFIPELPPLLEASGRLELVEGDESAVLERDGATGDHRIGALCLGPGYRLHGSSGHTPGLLLAEIPSAGGPILFAADLIPGVPWVHLPVTMGYDRCPERLIDEKTALLEDLVARGGRLFFTHDPELAMGRVTVQDGRYGVGETWARVEALPL